ncbi:PKD domain-containing protein [Parashewanella spongiae]|nr:PKD domain-containing protein [Parashewanella spongiae]
MVTFTNNTTGGSGELTYAWAFGDNNTSTLESPQHTYSAAGTYSVTLKVTDANGKISSATENVTVTAPVVTPPPPPAEEKSSGGSLSWFGVILVSLLGLRRKYRY